MINGFFTASFQTPVGNGSGVAYLTGSDIYGGDGGFTYTGTYKEIDGHLDACLHIAPIHGASAQQSVFGSLGRAFNLVLTGKPDPQANLECAGASPEFPGVGFEVNLRRLG